MLLRLILLGASVPAIAAGIHNPVAVDVLSHLQNANTKAAQNVAYLNEAEQAKFLPKVTNNIVKITKEIGFGIADVSAKPGQIVTFSSEDQLALCKKYGEVVQNQKNMLTAMAEKKLFLSAIFLNQGVPNGVPQSVEELLGSLYQLPSVLIPVVPGCKESVMAGQKALDETILKIVQQSVKYSS